MCVRVLDLPPVSSENVLLDVDKTRCHSRVSRCNCSSPTDLVTDVDFSPFDDFLLASGSADRTVSGAGLKSCL